MAHENYKNCESHTWPNSARGGSQRSIGVVEYEQCNNCLAMRLLYKTDVKINNEWVRLTDTKIVEPNFSTDNGISHEDLFRKS
jgi:hypothetical protein